MLYILFAEHTLLVVLAAILLHVLSAVTYMNLARKAGIRNWWVAWIPLGSLYLKVKLIDVPFIMMGIPIAMILIDVFSIGDVPGYYVYDIKIILITVVYYLIWKIYSDRKLLQFLDKNGNMAFIHLIPAMGTLISFAQIMLIALQEKGEPRTFDIHRRINR